MNTANTNQRKHTSQMAQAERQAIRSFINSVSVWQGLNNPHLIERKNQKRITDSEIIETLKHGEIIEAHANNYPDIRFVMRHIQNNRAICVCAAKRGYVITAWTNRPGDNHFSLDKSQYKWDADLTSVFDTRKG